MSEALVDVVLHVGADKTGTTSIQQMLRLNQCLALLEECAAIRAP